MSWIQYVLIVWFGLGAVLAITQVGKPRKPTTSGDAAITLLTTIGLTILVLNI